MKKFVPFYLENFRKYGPSFERIIHFYALFGLCNYSGYIF